MSSCWKAKKEQEKKIKIDELCYNSILNREEIEKKLKSFLLVFEKEFNNLNFKKGVYLYGLPGSGKTFFVKKILTQMGYDIISFDAGNIRNKSFIDGITSNNMSRENVLNIMHGKSKKIAILMDEIDGMNSGDKGGITSLIKLIRQKKTKKQKLEAVVHNPIICIGNYYIDKKIKELMKVCDVFELKIPTNLQIGQILDKVTPHPLDHHHRSKWIEMINGDLRKIDVLQRISSHRSIIHQASADEESKERDAILEKLFRFKKARHLDTKQTTLNIMQKRLNVQTHSSYINETDRTIVGLLYHENIIDAIKKEVSQAPSRYYSFYAKILKNMCFADYIDRITFQYQIWVFNEMTSLIKTYSNNHHFHEEFPHFASASATATKAQAPSASDMRFTKVLTKYSTEYNNQFFLYNLCISMQMDKKDMLAFFQELRLIHGTDMLNNSEKFNMIYSLFEKYDISKLDIKRIYRYLDKNIKNEIDLLILPSSSSSSSTSSTSSFSSHLPLIVSTNIKRESSSSAFIDGCASSPLELEFEYGFREEEWSHQT
jgi:DNA polymerase III delta prime subunit